MHYASCNYDYIYSLICRMPFFYIIRQTPTRFGISPQIGAELTARNLCGRKIWTWSDFIQISDHAVHFCWPSSAPTFSEISLPHPRGLVFLRGLGVVNSKGICLRLHNLKCRCVLPCKFWAHVTPTFWKFWVSQNGIFIFDIIPQQPPKTIEIAMVCVFSCLRMAFWKFHSTNAPCSRDLVQEEEDDDC